MGWFCLAFLIFFFFFFCVCVFPETGGTDEVGDEQEEEGFDNSCPEQLDDATSSVALEGSR